MWWLSIILKPLFFMALLYCVLHPARRSVERRMKDGKLKRLLLTRLN